jgi:hypothetical protein
MTVDGVAPAVIGMGRYNIARFSWELPAVLKRRRVKDGFFDKIWTISGFSARALRAALDRPV